jgi:predicted metal-dependent hydrolase
LKIGIVEPQIIFSKRRTLVLQISPKGLFVRAPLRTPMKYIIQLLVSKKDWIEGKIKILNNKEDYKTEYFLNSESEIWLYGEKLKSESNLDRKIIYKLELEKYLEQNLLIWANRIGVNFKTVKVKKLKAKWGSCSLVGNLVFNSSLAKCPVSIIDYVIIHELCHRKQMNHSKKFWDLVTQFCPDWRTAKKWFRIYGSNVLE